MYNISSIIKHAIASIFVTAIIGFDLANNSHQAQAIEFRVGYNGSAALSDAGSAIIRGQSFTLNVAGSYGPANTENAILKSIRFLYNESSPTPSVGTTVLIYSSLPTLAELNIGGGSGFLFQSNAFSTVVPGNDTTTTAADGFVGSGFSASTGARRSVLFEFTSSPVLNAGTTYFALFTTGQAIVRSGGNPYTGGSSYFDNGTALTVQGSDDRVFVVTAESIPFEFEATGGVLVLGGLFTLHRLRKKS